MKAERVKSIANEITGENNYERYQKLLNLLDASSSRGVRAIYNEVIEQGASGEEAASAVFRAIRRF